MTKSPYATHPSGFFITGTDTGIGKTIVTACLLNLFNRNVVRAGAMKPVETGISGAFSDAKFLIQAGSLDERPEDISPYRLKTPAAPQVASIMEKTSIEISNILMRFDRLCQKHETLLVEGVGGLLVPIAKNYFVADLAQEMKLPLIIVTRPDLGTINHTLMTLECANKRGLKIHGIIINEARKTDEGSVQNKSLEILQNYSDSPLLGRLPHLPQLTSKHIDPKWINTLAESLLYEAFVI